MAQYLYEDEYRLVVLISESNDIPTWTIHINKSIDQSQHDFSLLGIFEWTAQWYSIMALDFLATISLLLTVQHVEPISAEKLAEKLKTLYETEFMKRIQGEEAVLDKRNVIVDTYAESPKRINPFTEDLDWGISDGWTLYMLIGDLFLLQKQVFSLYVFTLKRIALKSNIDERSLLKGIEELIEKGYIRLEHSVVIPTDKLMERLGIKTTSE